MDNKVSILLIDDDELDRLQFKRELNKCDLSFELTECEDSLAAKTAILENQFDCIFLDYLLPSNNGLDFLKELRSEGVSTPIIIITSQGNEGIAVELMKSGASDYVIKNDIKSSLITQIIRTTQRVVQVEKAKIEAEKALRESQSRLAEAQKIAKIGNWELDIVTGAMRWSYQVYEIFELDSSNFAPTSKIFLSFVHSDDLEFVKENTREALGGKEFDIDFRIVISGKIKYLNSRGYLIKDNEGAPLKLVGTYQDVTERKLSEIEILKAREAAEASMKVREAFLANMSHEIRTPMNAVLGFTRLLYETELTPEQKAYIDSINFSGENLLVIINDILDLSKIQSGKLTLENHPFELHNTLEEVVKMLRPKANEKSLLLQSEIGSNVPSWIMGDQIRLTQIMTNLLNNAIKFTEKGSVELKVELINDDELKFIIKDTGIGISRSNKSKIFESFEQASEDTTRKYGGTGLGLSIVKNLVQMMNGTIEVESELGKGTTFTVELPVEKTDPVQETESKEALSQDDFKEQISGSKILIAEDNMVNQLLVERALKKLNCEIELVNNGAEAVEKYQLGQFDIILMDVQMPTMNGYEATEKIRSISRDIPIIGFTAHALAEERDKCLNAGMNDCLCKPYKDEELYSKIGSLLRKCKTTA